MRVKVEKSNYEIPDDRPYTVRMMIQEMGTTLRKEYVFTPGSENVQVQTFEGPESHYFKVSDADVTYEYNLIEEHNEPLSKFQLPENPWDRDEVKLAWWNEQDPRYRGLSSEEWYRRKKEAEETNHRRSWWTTASRDLLERVPLENVNNPLLERKPNVSKFKVGARVWFRGPSPDNKMVTGTVARLGKGSALICADKPHKMFQTQGSICGKNHGVSVPESSLHPIDLNGVGAYADVPDFVGVVVSQEFVHQDVVFKRNDMGRVLSWNGSSATVAWYSVRHPKLRTEAVGDNVYSHVWTVPGAHLEWALLHRMTDGNFRVKTSWQQGGGDIPEGALLIYDSDRPNTFAGRQTHHVMTRGAILRYRNYDDQRCCIVAEIVGGMPQECIGTKLTLKRPDVRIFDEPLFSQDEGVEVVAEVVFRKANLQGKRGKILLPTDADGEVGIEFMEDLGAGSLDGMGKEGRCLYVPARSIKKVSE